MEHRTFLIIDDDPAYRGFITRSLRMMGAQEVFQADNGEAGVALAERKRPDLIILDIRMPAVNGLTVIRRLKESALTTRIPVLVATGEPNFHLVCDEQHASGVLAKPFTQRQLLAQLRLMLPEVEDRLPTSSGVAAA